MREYNLELFADYHQFYIQDESSESSLEDSWTEFATENLIAVNDGIVGIGTVRDFDVSVKIVILNSEPVEINVESFDIITECDLKVTSGKIVVAGCTDYFPEAKRIEIDNGIYRLRTFYGNLNKIDEYGIEGEDFYEVYLWKSDKSEEVKVLKNINASL